VVVIRGISGGFLPAFAEIRGARVVYREPDRIPALHMIEAAGFAAGDVELEIGRLLPGSIDGDTDLTVVIAGPPLSLAENRVLTREFFRRAGDRLGPEGVFAVVLPAAAGFIHPSHLAYIDAVSEAMKEAFPHHGRVHAPSGHLLLTGSGEPVRPAPGRMEERYRVVAPDVRAGAAAIATAAKAIPWGPPVMERYVGGANTVLNPRAYFRAVRFAGRFAEGDATSAGALAETGGAAIGAFIVAAALAMAEVARRRYPGAGRVFWSGCMSAMVLAFCLYVYQSVAGHAYRETAALIAASMGGIWAGARMRFGRPLGLLRLLPGFLCMFLFPLLASGSVPRAFILPALIPATATAGFFAGQAMRVASHANRGRQNVAGVLFAADLCGGAFGLLCGAALLPFRCGFGASGTVFGLAALIALLRDPGR
jgi:hypothetical protein